MAAKKLYCIVDNDTGKIYPDTHLFVLNSVVKAGYALCAFAAKLVDSNISLYNVGELDFDFSDDEPMRVIGLPMHFVCSFDDFLNFIDSLSDDELDIDGFNRKSYLMHYNICKSNLIDNRQRFDLQNGVFVGEENEQSQLPK